MVSSDRPVALITGGTRGFGRALAVALASTHHLLIGGTDRTRAEEVCDQLPSAEPFVADLSDPSQVAQAVRTVDRLGVLVHSAGIAPVGTADESSREDWRRVFDVNVFAVAELTRLMLPRLRAASGTVVLVNSGAGLRGQGAMAAYSASKFALTGFGQALRDSEKGRVRVISVHPGRMDTDMQRGMSQAWGRAYVPAEHLRPESVAGVVAAAILAPPDASVDVIEIRPR